MLKAWFLLLQYQRLRLLFFRRRKTARPPKKQPDSVNTQIVMVTAISDVVSMIFSGGFFIFIIVALVTPQ